MQLENVVPKFVYWGCQFHVLRNFISNQGWQIKAGPSPLDKNGKGWPGQAVGLVRLLSFY